MKPLHLHEDCHPRCHGVPLGAGNRSGLASTGTGLNNGDAAGDEVDFFAEREGGDGRGAPFWPEFKSELDEALRSKRCGVQELD